MKDNYKKQDYKDYRKGHRIATEIGHLMGFDTSPQNHLNEWLRDASLSKKFTDKLSSEETLSAMCDQFDRKEKHTGSKRLIETLQKKRSKIGKVQILKIFSLSAAAAIAALSLLVYYFQTSEEVQPVIAENFSTGTIKNTFSKPTLVRNNGEEIDLTVITAGLLNEKRISLLSLSDSIRYNTVIIPKKYTYTLSLEDGTVVHLNSYSKLRYPNKFGKDKREVFLSGEAFFEVKKGSAPFIVHINNVAVRVYGTKFNINAYNSGNIKTALIEGSVSVKQQGDTIETFIKPNQLITINNDGTKTISTILPERYTAWMDGFIRADEEPMSNLLDNIANWYGIEFTYNQKINQISVNASFDRERPIEELISALELISGVKITKINEEKYMIE